MLAALACDAEDGNDAVRRAARAAGCMVWSAAMQVKDALVGKRMGWDKVTKR